MPYRILRKGLRETLRDGPRHPISGRWLNIDGVLGIAAVGGEATGFLIHQPAGRNLDNGSLHLDRIYCPLTPLNRRFNPGDTILKTRFRLIAGDAKATQKLLEDTIPCRLP